MSAWTILGLKRTDNINAIRRAYARKLKATDVDADPAAFIALRQALERALAEARNLALKQASIPVAAFADEEEGEATVIVRALPRSADPPAPADAAPGTADGAGASGIEDGNARFVALDRLLFADEDGPLDPVALATAVRAIIDHRDMDRIDHEAQVEDWLARALHHAIPRSDPVIPLAVAHFGWEDERGAVHRRPFVALVAQRADDLACIARLRAPGHRWHDAYERLCQPVSGGIGFGDRVRLKPQIAQLLTSLRTHYPEVERSLDARQVAMWDLEIGRRAYLYPERRQGISWYGWLCLGWAIFNLAAITGQAFH